MGGQVVERIYSGMGHVVNDDEVEIVRILIDGMRHGTVGAPFASTTLPTGRTER